MENSTAPRLRKAGYSFRVVSPKPHIAWIDGIPLAGREQVIARTKVSEWWRFLEPSGWATIRRLSTIGWRKSVLIELALGQLGGSNPRMIGIEPAYISRTAEDVWRLGWGYAMTHPMDRERWSWLSWRMENLCRLEVQKNLRTGVRYYT